MREKRFSRGIVTVSVMIIAIVAVVFISMVSNAHLAKGTYAKTTCSCSTGYTLTVENKCVKINTNSVSCTQGIVGGESVDGCATYESQGYTCTVVSGGSQGVTKTCTKETQEIKEPVCDWTASCYVYNGKYIWATTESQAVGNPVSLSQSACSGCVTGYHPSGSLCVEDSQGGDDDDTLYAPSNGCYPCGNTYLYYAKGSALGIGCKSNTPNSDYVKYSETTNLCKLKSEVESEKTVTLTFASYTGSVLDTRSCTIAVGSNACTEDLVAPSGSIPSVSGKVFNGWGGSAGCTSGSYRANATFHITRDSSNKTYYACYKDDEGESPSDFDSTKCQYSFEGTVTRDERYLNCKYRNIAYNSDPTADTVEHIHACCNAIGYTWVPSNFTSSGFGNEYCIICGGNDSACYLVNHKYVWSSSVQSDGTLVSSITESSKCTGCESGYAMDSSKNCVKPSTGGACYLVNHKYVWSTTIPSGGTLVSSITTSSKCTGCESGYTKDSSNNCVKPSTGGACYLVDHKYVWASSKPSGGTLVSSITTSSKCTGCESGYKMSSSNKCVNSSQNITVNPPTGTIAIVIAWLIGLFVIGYAFWYFKNNKERKNKF